MRSTIGIELIIIMSKNKALINPFLKWNGHLPLCTMLSTYNNCSPTCIFMNYVGGASVNKPSPKTSLEEQTLTSEGLFLKKTFSTWNLARALMATLSKMHTNQS
jgi:hypothetical protein